MLDVHPSHHAAHSWRDFFVHIATIVIGLLVAVGLEQAVEFVHHRHQRDHLEEQMREVLEQDRIFLANGTEQFRKLREYLVEIQIAIADQLKGRKVNQPPRLDPRSAFITPLPNLAPYQAAKENGTVALLDTERIRLYNRIAFQRDLLQTALDRWFGSLNAMDAFRKRYDMSRDSRVLGKAVPAADVTRLSPAELVEYRAMIGVAIDATDQMIGRFALMDLIVHTVLDGAKDESELLARIKQELAADVEGK